MLSLFYYLSTVADLTVRKLMEGSSNIQCRALKAKMINGDSINVSAEHVSVDVIYGEQTSISATDDITVGLLKGNIEVPYDMYTRALFIVIVCTSYSNCRVHALYCEILTRLKQNSCGHDLTFCCVTHTI